MANEDKSSPMAAAFSAGLPKLLLGPAGDALSRLLGAKVEKKAAQFDADAQPITDAKEAQSKVTDAIAAKVAEMAIADPDTMDRAFSSMVAREYQSQKNKDAIVKEAVRELEENPPSPDSGGPTAAWVHRFESYAEDASEEDLQLAFGKLLAGEISKRGTVSNATLHFVAMLDQQTTTLINRVLPYCVAEGVAFSQAISPPLSFSEAQHLEQVGFWSQNIRYSKTYDANGNILIPMNDKSVLMLSGNPGVEIDLPGSILSMPARQLAHAIAKSADFDQISLAISANESVTMIRSGIRTKCAEGRDQVIPTGHHYKAQ